MSGSPLPLVGAGASGLAILLLAAGVLSARPRQRGVAGALASIEAHYGQQAMAESRPDASRSAALPPWARKLALRLSPAGIAGTLQRRLDLAGNAAGWTADRILALKGIATLLGSVL